MTRYAVSKSLALPILAWLAGHAPLRATDGAEFRSQYAAHEPKLYEQYITNRRVKVEVKAFGKLKPSGTLEGRAEHVIVSRADAFRATTVVLRADHNWSPTGGSAVMCLGNVAYGLTRPAASGYKIEEYYSVDTHRNKIEELAHRCKLFLPLSFNGGFRLSYHFDAWDRQRAKCHRYEILSVGQAGHRGRPAIKVVTRGDDVTTTAYFDQRNHYAFLGYETDAGPGVLGPGSKACKMAGELTYSDGPDGFPLPKEYKSWFAMPDGRQIPREEVTFTEYARYIPTDDDFDLEKQFGVKPLPPPGTAASTVAAAAAGRRAWWLYAAAGVLGAITVGLLAYRWKRRATADT